MKKRNPKSPVPSEQKKTKEQSANSKKPISREQQQLALLNELAISKIVDRLVNMCDAISRELDANGSEYLKRKRERNQLYNITDLLLEISKAEVECAIAEITFERYDQVFSSARRLYDKLAAFKSSPSPDSSYMDDSKNQDNFEISFPQGYASDVALNSRAFEDFHILLADRNQVCNELMKFRQRIAGKVYPEQFKSQIGMPAEPTNIKKNHKSFSKGDARKKLISALSLHHNYQGNGRFNKTPIGNNDLARSAQVDKSTAHAFFNKEFGEYNSYKSMCRSNPTALEFLLKRLNEEDEPKQFRNTKIKMDDFEDPYSQTKDNEDEDED